MKSLQVLVLLSGCSALGALSGCQPADSKLEAKREALLHEEAEREALLHELESARSTNAPMRIQPGVGVGPIRFGMSREELIAAIGEPYKKTGQAYEYQKLGVAVMLDGEDRVQVILCGAWCNPSDVLLDVFKGTTDDGLGLRASRADVVAACGEPQSLKTLGTGFEVLRYESMRLAVRDGKLVHMTFMAPRG